MSHQTITSNKNLTIESVERRIAPYRNILVPLDGTNFAETVLSHAINLAQGFDAECHLVRALPVFGYTGEGVVFPGAVPLAMTNMEVGKIQRARDRELAEHYLAEVQERLRSVQVKSTAAVVSGPVEKAILEHERKVEADLILIASSQRSGLARLLAPNTSTKLCNQATCPVLVITGTETECRFGESKLSREIHRVLDPHTVEFAAALEVEEEVLKRALPRALGMILSAMAQERRRGPDLYELFELTLWYPHASNDISAHLLENKDKPGQGLVSQVFRGREHSVSESLSRDVKGLSQDRATKLLALLSPIVLSILKSLAEEGSELGNLIEQAIDKDDPEVRDSAQKASEIVNAD